MNGVTAEKTKKNLKTCALKMKAVYSFEFIAHTFSNIRCNNQKKESSNAADSSCLPLPMNKPLLGICFPHRDEFPSYLLYRS